MQQSCAELALHCCVFLPGSLAGSKSEQAFGLEARLLLDLARPVTKFVVAHAGSFQISRTLRAWNKDTSGCVWGCGAALLFLPLDGATLRNVFAQRQSHQARISATTSPTMVKKNLGLTTEIGGGCHSRPELSKTGLSAYLARLLKEPLLK